MGLGAVIRAGDYGAGQAAKICNNMVLGATMIATCEAFALAEKLGLDAERFFEKGVFAGFEGFERDGGVGLGDGEVEDDVDGGVGEQFIDGADFGDAMLGGFGAGGVEVDVGAGGHVVCAFTCASSGPDPRLLP